MKNQKGITLISLLLIIILTLVVIFFCEIKLTSERDTNKNFRTSSTNTTNTPSTSTTGKSSTNITNTPSTSETSKPSTSTTNTPSTSATSKPSTSTTNTPSTSTTSKPSTSTTNTPSTSTTSKPSTKKPSANTKLKNYQQIYNEYSQKLINAGPTSSISEMADICNEGVTKMAEYMYSASGIDGQYATYQSWAEKLYDVYMSNCR